ncbi:hypothetical protein, partial [Hyella patelloides]|uniref:hypothetical protein n=1 Tax=Hyella patelloides TaxID=1982969 RepID=UPI0011A5BC13
MFLFSKYNALTINLITCCILLISSTKNAQALKKTKGFKTLPEIQQPSENVPSLSERFSETRKKTEFLDDRTETMLNRHKKWFLMGSMIFLWLCFQSFMSYRRD